MENEKLDYEESLNLSKFIGSFVAEVNGKRCVCLPIKEGRIFEGKAGNYLNLKVVDHPNDWGHTHFVTYRKTKDDKDAQLPIVGNLKPINYEKRTEEQQQPANNATDTEDDLPF